MPVVLTALAVLACFWALSRASVFIIDRCWPPAGRIMTIGGLRVHVKDVPAQRSGPAVLLIHGASGNLRDPISALSDALGGEFRLIAIDRPGHGHSDRGSRDMSDPARQADVVAMILDRFEAAPCVVLGHSWGAAVAAALAQRHPDSVAGLVLVSPATHPWPGGISRRTRLFAVPYLGRLLAELAVVPLGFSFARPAVKFVFAPDPVPPGYMRRIAALLAIRPKTFVANARDVADLHGHLIKLSVRYHEIRAPTEILTGDQDPIVSPAIHAYGLAREIPGSRLTILPGAGHMPHWSRTLEIVAAIRRLAGGLPRERGSESERFSGGPPLEAIDGVADQLVSGHLGQQESRRVRQPVENTPAERQSNFNVGG